MKETIESNQSTNRKVDTETTTALISSSTTSSSTRRGVLVLESFKFLASLSFLLSAIYTTYNHRITNQNDTTYNAKSISYFTPSETSSSVIYNTMESLLFGTSSTSSSNNEEISNNRRRRLLEASSSSLIGNEIPSYMKELMDDLKKRQKLFDDTPPEEVKYWFEYTGPLQVCFDQ